MENLKISVIVPVYNTEGYLARCLGSLLSQSFRNLEIIVVNDGSKGNIRDIIKPYQASDSRVLFVDGDTNQGLFRARLAGAKKSTGDYICFVDSDDYVSYDFYRNLLDRASETGADICIGDTVWEDGSERYIYNFHESALSFDTLSGDEVRAAYFGQEAACYSWHTVWNKLYRRSLWEECLPFYQKLAEHIVMTEDIAFSSVLFYKAKKVARVCGDAYFYCMNKNASTDASRPTRERFIKNIHDLKAVFAFVQDFLKEQKASEDICAHFARAKDHYGRMWQHLLDDSFKGEDKAACQQAMDGFWKGSLPAILPDYYFEQVRTSWNGGLPYLKEQVGHFEGAYISFDIFDTLLLRPFYRPEDLFLMLDKVFQDISGTNVLFSKMRREGEALARRFYAKTDSSIKDITLTEIYDYIQKAYGLSPELAQKMKEAECRLEIGFVQPRRAGLSLFNLARYQKKHVLLVTDMYLERETIVSMLEKCGISGYDCLFISCEERRLKYDGGLFRAVTEKVPVKPQEILHIGDTWNSDILGCQKAGIRSLFLPKAREIFENRIQGSPTNRCSTIGKDICGRARSYDKASSSLVFGIGQALSFNRYFDNPYRSFNSTSDFNCDPFFIGYSLLGPHILGLVRWIDEEARRSGRSRVFFCARDGYLPKMAYDLYARYIQKPLSTGYIQASRKALLPAILRWPLSFYQLPAEYRGHSPKSLMAMLSFAGKDISEAAAARLFGREGLPYDKTFEDAADYHRFIALYLDNFYSEKKHREAIGLLKEYYSQVGEDALCFDMGYSGRIQDALSFCCGRGVEVLYIHEDIDSSSHLKHLMQFPIRDFYDARPAVTGLIREHIFSDPLGSCTGFVRKDGHVVPVLEESDKNAFDCHVVGLMHRGALSFLKDYLDAFGPYEGRLYASREELSYPFEGFLRTLSDTDRQIFRGAFFEDTVYGGLSAIPVEEFISRQNFLLEKEQAADEGDKAAQEPSTPSYSRDYLTELLNTKSKPVRAMLLLLIDKKLFMQKLKKNLGLS